MDILIQYDWPGNVRELQNLVERALILHPKGPLTFEQLHPSREQDFPPGALPSENVETLDLAMSKHIRMALEKSQGKIHGKNGAAALLGINPSTLRSRMKKLNIPTGRK
jgi:DNA-binding NtrC family response regulator